MFLDEALCTFVSGKGGSGAVGFHKEKHVPRGGPNGADGGRGGDVLLIADRNKRTLYDFKLKQLFEAKDGEHGFGNKRGKDAKDIEIKVPVGTIVTDIETGDILVDMAIDGMRYVLCRGGRGGKGNLHFVSSVRQAPNFAEKGEPGERIHAKLELKLLADVGLIGLPNAGKSTLIAQISAARPKIADYPFTTLVPNLGVVSYRNDSFVVADMPGLIEGASQGIGLGHQFLRHIERTQVLVHVVDVFPVDESDPVRNFHIIEEELKLYSEEIYGRPRAVALNKIDLVDETTLTLIKQRFDFLQLPQFEISGATGKGIDALLDFLHTTLETAKADPVIPTLMPVLKQADDMHWEVHRQEDGWEIFGKRVVRMVSMTDLENDYAVRHLHRRLERIGVIEKLREMGAKEGDTVYVGDTVFAFSDR